VTSILVSKPVIEHCSGDQSDNSSSLAFSLSSNSTSTVDSDIDIDCEMKVTVAVTFMAGIIQVYSQKKNIVPNFVVVGKDN
jgi:hypothetical protein